MFRTQEKLTDRARRWAALRSIFGATIITLLLAPLCAQPASAQADEYDLVNPPGVTVLPGTSNRSYSGVAFSGSSNTVFVVDNASNRVMEYNPSTRALVRIISTNIGMSDPEDITWMYNRRFAIVDEDTSIIHVVDIPNGASSLNPANVVYTVDTAIATDGFNGLEGISFVRSSRGSGNEQFYVVWERPGPPRIYLAQQSGSVSEPFTLTGGITDAAAIHHSALSGNIFVLSEDSRLLIEYSSSGAVIDSKPIVGFGQPEGIAFTLDESDLYIVGEPRQFGHYQRDAVSSDNSPPNAEWTSPPNESTRPAPISLVGTATDNVGVDRVELLIRDRTTGAYWNAVTETWGPLKRFSANVDNPGSSSVGFTYQFNPSTGSGNYRARAFAIDTADNEDATGASRRFQIDESAGDTTAPTATISAPTNGATVAVPTVIRGQAMDNIGVDHLDMVIRDTDTGLWWNPTSGSWGSFNRFRVAVNTPGASTTGWEMVFDPPAPALDTQYRFRVWAVDTSGNETTGNVSRKFSGSATSDSRPPTASWSSPNSGQTVSAPANLAGSLADNVAVTGAEMVIRDLGTGLWWNSASGTWGPFKRLAVPVANPGATVTTFSYSFNPATGSGDYRARVWAIDGSANRTSNNVSRTFSIG